MALLAVIGVSNAAAQISPDDFNAVPALSTESRYGMGLFTSDVDDFIDVNGYDPDIGTFFFLGGFPAGAYVDDTDLLATSGAGGNYAISAGFARSFSKFYLGVYLGGTVVNAGGNSTGNNSFSTAAWNTNLAVLFGNSGLGGLRLDLILDAVDTTTKVDGEKVGTGSPSGGTSSGEGVTVALRWGNTLTVKSKDIDAHAVVGFRFPDYELAGSGSNKIHNWGTHTTTGKPAELLVSGGIAWDLNDISTLEADLILGGDFGGASFGNTSDTTLGGFGAGIEAGLSNSFEPLDGLELALRPGLGIGLYGNQRPPNDDFGTIFDLSVGVDAGLKARLPGRLEKLSLVTGISVNIFNWNVDTVYGDDLSADWSVGGISWNRDAFTEKGTLGLGMVLAPNDNLSIGFGVNALIDSIVEIDLVQMQLRSGKFFTDFDDPLIFDLTVSYKF
jgi:hypothetical protein